MTAILFISIAFSVFILNKDFSVKSVKDNVVLDEAETSLVQQGEVGSTSQIYAKEEPAKPSELELDNTQHSLSKAEGEGGGNNSLSEEKLITWVNDKEALAEMDDEMGLIEPTEYDQMLL